MYFRRVLSAIILISVSLIYYSCDTITNPTSAVSGKVYTYNYLAISNVKVTIRDQVALTSEDGSFNFKNITSPYDLIVLDSLERNVTVYKELSAESILLPLQYYASNNGYAFIIVTIPKEIIDSNIVGKVIFTDGNFVNSYSDIHQNDTVIGVEMYINESVTGKLIVLTYKRDNEGKIISYENYGESPDIQIEPGGNYNYQFDTPDLSLNPGEQSVTGYLQIPPGSSSSSSFKITFSSKKTYYAYSGFSSIGLNYFNFLIPAGLPRQFNTIVESSSYGGMLGYSTEDFITYPNEPNNLQVKLAPSIISPDDQIKNVNNNTQFSFNSGTGNGIYIISLRNTSRDFHYKIVTSNLNFTLEGLEDLGLGRINNNYFYWSVQKIGPANSMNDYVTNFFNEPSHFNSESDSRFFSTEP
ncbi:MAG: hypothetical protein ABI840_13090 [bacterium]